MRINFASSSKKGNKKEKEKKLEWQLKAFGVTRKRNNTYLNANKVSLNVSKTELIIFKPRIKKEIGFDIKLKLNGKRIYPAKSVKYFVIKIDESLTWMSILMILTLN